MPGGSPAAISTIKSPDSTGRYKQRPPAGLVSRTVATEYEYEQEDEHNW
jgi:hypothetical protein